MMSYEKFRLLLNRSKEYKMAGSVLIIRDYHTGAKVELDLSMMSEEAFDEMAGEYNREMEDDGDDW